MVASLGTAIGTSVSLSDNGPVRRDLLQAAEDSLTDGNDANDIDPNSSGDLCVMAREETQPGRVRNAAVTTVCNKADALATASTATWIATGVLAVPTIVFSVLVFTYREEPDGGSESAFRRHQPRLSFGPTPDGGVMAGAGFRF
jgi:hypothetical protein